MKKLLIVSSSLGALLTGATALAVDEAPPAAETAPPSSEEIMMTTAAPAPLEPAPVSVPETPYMKRYKPEPMMFELGIFGGVMFPSSDHELLSVPDSQQVPYNTAADLGVRFAFFPATFFGIEAEAAAMPSGTENGSAGLWAARAHGILQVPGSSITPFLLVGGGALGASSEDMGSDTDPAFHFGIGAKAALDEHLSLRLDVRDTVTANLAADGENGGAAHSPEILLGLTFVPKRTKPDADGDGFLDHRDNCPGVAGTDGGCPVVPPDADGDGVADDADECKDVAGLAPTGCPDKDGDGLLDRMDPCPDVAGPAPTGCPEKVCPIQDADGDGLVDSVDQCPNEPARTVTGCVIKDQDGDGILDVNDKCPTERETKNGLDDADGCPDIIPEKVTKFVGVIKGIEFDLGSAKIKKQSEPLLKEAAAVIKSVPSLRVMITGHTDDQGERDANLKLSGDRAASVKDFLIKEGVAEGQLQTKGAGPDLPLADNKTAAGRQKNRRIEFMILQD
jgi:outer membrane protein OmpA-like peptidoglycan-associated protein